VEVLVDTVEILMTIRLPAQMEKMAPLSTILVMAEAEEPEGLPHIPEVRTLKLPPEVVDHIIQMTCWLLETEKTHRRIQELESMLLNQEEVEELRLRH
jgi:hypothetical protein